MKKNNGNRILVIEDDVHIAEGVKLNLTLQGHDVRIAGDGVSGLEQWKEWQPDIIILDIMLPGIDGLSVLQNIRLEDERIPILILSAKSAPDDRVRGLSYGVDDYLSKPFNLEEFLLRVERLMKRSAWSSDSGELGDVTAPAAFRFGGNSIDFGRGTAIGRGGEIKLTEQELKLLKLFIAHKNRPLSRKKLLEIGWGYTRVMSTRTVDNFMVRLRRYFEEDPKRPQYFKSLRSVGYVFTPPENGEEEGVHHT